MNILVTGGAGYLGGHMTALCLAAGMKPTVVDRFMFQPKRDAFAAAFPRARVLEADYRALSAEHLKNWEINGIIHLAAMGSDPSAAIDVPETYSNNTTGTAELARQARQAGVGAFVFASSCSVYGAGNGHDMKPGDHCAPVSEYGASKLSAEVLLQYEAPGLRIARLGTLAGPGDRSTRTRFDIAINAMTRSALLGRITVMGGGAQWRPMIDVWNAAHAMLSLLRQPLGIYNLSSYNVQTVSLASEIARAVVEYGAPAPEIRILLEEADKRNYHVQASELDYGDYQRSAFDSALALAYGMKKGTVREEPDTYQVWEYELIEEEE